MPALMCTVYKHEFPCCRFPQHCTQNTVDSHQMTRRTSSQELTWAEVQGRCSTGLQRDDCPKTKTYCETNTECVSPGKLRDACRLFSTSLHTDTGLFFSTDIFNVTVKRASQCATQMSTEHGGEKVWFLWQLSVFARRDEKPIPWNSNDFLAYKC